jgi:phosphatidylglycerol:prolipoprotein diacylglycerol transferase
MRYTHDIDPVIGTILGIHLWWYGLSYTLGFLNAHFYLKRRRHDLGLDLQQVFCLSLLLMTGVLVGGRVIEVAFYEWPFYSENLELIPAYWLGGMASHGLLLGGLIAVWIFCRINKVPFLRMTDALSIPATFILGMGRIGNFIDGQIVGSVTTVPWAVKFPDAEGFRHPVVLYDGIKNLLIIPVLAALARYSPRPGVVTGVFVFLYSFLRIPVDVFREYPTSLLGLATGQMLNLAFSVIGIAIVVRAMNSLADEPASPHHIRDTVPAERTIRIQQIAFVSILLFCLTMPSDWTQNVPDRYGSRHHGLVHSNIYPDIDPEPN